MVDLIETYTSAAEDAETKPLPERHILARLLDREAFEHMVWPDKQPDGSPWPVDDAVYVGGDFYWRAVKEGRRKDALAMADQILAHGWRRDHG